MLIDITQCMKDKLRAILFLPLLFTACRVQQPMSSERFAHNVQNDIPFKVR